MEEELVLTPEVSKEVVLVAIVNKDTLEDKMKEAALMTLVTSVCTVLVTQGAPFIAKKITEFRTKRALAKKTEDITEKKD